MDDACPRGWVPRHVRYRSVKAYRYELVWRLKLQCSVQGSPVEMWGRFRKYPVPCIVLRDSIPGNYHTTRATRASQLNKIDRRSCLAITFSALDRFALSKIWGSAKFARPTERILSGVSTRSHSEGTKPEAWEFLFSFRSGQHLINRHHFCGRGIQASSTTQDVFITRGKPPTDRNGVRLAHPTNVQRNWRVHALRPDHVHALQRAAQAPQPLLLQHRW